MGTRQTRLLSVTPLAVLAVALLLGACAAPPVQLAPSITVINRTERTIAEIRYRECAQATDIWQNFTVPALRPGEGTTLAFPMPCSDLDALYPDGRTAGSQFGVKQKFPLRWEIF